MFLVSISKKQTNYQTESKVVNKSVDLLSFHQWYTAVACIVLKMGTYTFLCDLELLVSRSHLSLPPKVARPTGVLRCT